MIETLDVDITEEVKFCKKCETTKPMSKFHQRHRRGKTRPSSYCAECSNKDCLEYRKSMNPAYKVHSLPGYIPETKECFRCKTVKSNQEFRVLQVRGYPRLCSYCIFCEKEYRIQVATEKRRLDTRAKPIVNGNKECVECNIPRPIESFYPEHPRVQNDTRRGSSYCKECRAIRAKRSRDASREKHPPKPVNRNVWLKSLYGITSEDYNDMLVLQGGVCAICKNPPTLRMLHLRVDHCHKTGRVRGLLCHGCNTGIGNLKDSEYNLKAAIQYLRKAKK